MCRRIWFAWVSIQRNEEAKVIEVIFLFLDSSSLFNLNLLFPLSIVDVHSNFLQ